MILNPDLNGLTILVSSTFHYVILVWTDYTMHISKDFYNLSKTYIWYQCPLNFFWPVYWPRPETWKGKATTGNCKKFVEQIQGVWVTIILIIISINKKFIIYDNNFQMTFWNTILAPLNTSMHHLKSLRQDEKCNCGAHSPLHQTPSYGFPPFQQIYHPRPPGCGGPRTNTVSSLSGRQ